MCGQQKKNQLIDRLRDGCLRLQGDESLPIDKRMVRFLTLTQALEDPIPIMTAWNSLRARLRKEGYRDIRFFLVKEFTKKGKRHLHILINQHIPSSLLRRLWRDSTKGHSYIVDIRRIDFKLGNPAGYMAKYMGKMMASAHFEKYEKRYTHDQVNDWSAVTSWRPPPGRWEYVYHPLFPVSLVRLNHPDLTASSDEGDPPPLSSEEMPQKAA